MLTNGWKSSGVVNEYKLYTVKAAETYASFDVFGLES